MRRLAWGLLLVLLAIGSYLWLMADRIPFGVRVLDMELGGLPRAEARNRLAACFDAYSQLTLTLTYGGKSWQLTPQELGLRLQAAETIALAHATGRQGHFGEQALSQLQMALRGREVPIAYFVDEKVENGVLDSMAKGIDHPAVDAAIVIEGAKVRVTPSKAGYTMDRAAAKDLLRGVYAHLSAEPIALPEERQEPSLREEDLASARAKAEHMLAAPLSLRFRERSWELSRERLAAMLRFNRVASSERGYLEVSLDPASIQAYGEARAKEIDRPEPQDAAFGWRAGHLAVVTPSLDALRLEVDKLPALVEAAALGGHTLELPVEVRRPKVSVEEMDRLGIKELIEERSTYYGEAYPERDFNVELAAQKLNGLLIAPGEVFTYSQAIGEISAQAGFKMGLSIIGNETVPDVGGGVCQVCTTIFQTAFWAGYPILERYPHAYWLSRYGPTIGLDATVAPPTVDFRFKNDTDTHILVQTRTENKRIYVAFYGTKPRWQVKVEGPFITNVISPNRTPVIKYSPYVPKGWEVILEKPSNGMDVRVVRTITLDGEEKAKGTFFSRYRPQGNVKLIGTGEGKPAYGIFLQ